MNRIRIAATLAALALIPAAAQAQTITACYVPKTGSVYRIQAEGSPTACKTNHIEFSWEAGGTTPAPAKPQEVMVSQTLQAGEEKILTAVCPTGTEAFSGAFRTIPPGDNVAFLSSGKSLPGWFIWARNDGAGPAEVAVHAFCVAYAP